MWIIQGLLIAFFLFASSIKILGWIKVIYEPQLVFFHRYGLNRAAMIMVGFVEATGALLMLAGLLLEAPLLGSVGAIFITFTSIGAMFFHFRFDTWKDAIPSMITLLLSLALLPPLLVVLVK